VHDERREATVTMMLKEKASSVPVEPRAVASDAVISIQGITKSFGRHTVLQDITFDVPRGKTSAVLGPSGTGKSVLLKVVIGLLQPEAGQVYIDGDPIVGVREKEVLRIRRKIGVLFQDGALFGSMNLFDNIAFPLVEHTNKTDKEVRNLVLRKSELVGLVDHLHKLPGEVSGGMRKRAGLARALVLEPQILFFDEPDSGLDPVRVAYLDDLINTVHEETGATFFIISHNIESVKRTAHYLGLLFRTKLVGFGTKEEMITSRVPVIEQFLAGRPEGPISMDEMADAAVVDTMSPGDSETLAAGEQPVPGTIAGGAK
jgi:phospholipid/cholesterol/gamma-HCH transport system ATP-binding protein